MRYALTTLLLIAASAASAAPAEPAAPALIQAERIADSNCRGSTDPNDINTRMECDRRSRLVGRLSQIGWCYGKKGQVGADFRWHRCMSQSNIINDLREGPAY